QGITKWVKSWAKQNWRTAAKQDVLNQDLWKKLIAAEEKREEYGAILWKLVVGHAGIPGNERVDEIATAFTQNSIPHLYNGPRNEYQVDLAAIIPDRVKKTLKDDKKQRSNKPVYSYISAIHGAIEIHKTWAEC